MPVTKISHMVIRNILLLLSLSSVVFAQALHKDGETSDANEATIAIKRHRVKFRVGYNWYRMKEFNEKLDREDMPSVSRGQVFNLEYSWVYSDAQDVSSIGIGFEHLRAESKRRFSSGVHSNTVHWHLPATGVYVAPTFHFESVPWICARPIGLGYYVLGGLEDAKLTADDNTGHLELSGDSWGYVGHIGAEYMWREWTKIFVELGYRELTFTDVQQAPKGGFKNVRKSNLPEELDYSGPIAKAGISLEF